MISGGASGALLPARPRHCSTCSTRRPARPSPGLASRHRRASARPLGRGAQGRDLGGRDDGGRTGVGVHGPSGTRSGDECEITLDGQVVALGGIAEKVLAAHRGGLGRVLLPLGHRRQVDEDLDDGLRRAVVVDYVTRTEELGRSGPASGGGRRAASRAAARTPAASPERFQRRIACGVEPRDAHVESDQTVHMHKVVSTDPDEVRLYCYFSYTIMALHSSLAKPDPL